MRNTLLLLAVMGLIYAVVSAPAEPLKRSNGEWRLIRAEGNEDSTTLTLTTAGDNGNIPSTATSIGGTSSGLMETANIRCVMAFCGGAAADKTFSYAVYGYAAQNGMAEFICAGTGTLGTQQVVKYPHNKAAATAKYWADTLTVTDATVWVRGVVTGDAAGSNRVAKISFDCTGLMTLYVEISDADGTTGTEAGNISVYARFY